MLPGNSFQVRIEQETDSVLYLQFQPLVSAFGKLAPEHVLKLALFV
jgi:hypothetical protein